MSLGLKIHKFAKTIGFKIAVGHFVIFTGSFMALTTFGYLLLDSALERRDRQMIETEMHNLQSHYQSGGWPAFQNMVVENDRLRKNNPFFTRFVPATDKGGRTFFPQYWKDFDLTALDEMSTVGPKAWIRLPNRKGTYILEIFTARQSDDSLFQVGISSEDRLSVLHRFQEMFLVGSIPLILLAVGGGVLLSQRVLRPLRNLIIAVASIEAGQMDARVPATHTGDELEELGCLFNRMIEKINQLIYAMKCSLDSVAHDLRTPMTRFRNKAEAALQQADPVVDHREALQECVEESERILRMLNMLMDISEAETGTMRLQIRPVDLVQATAGIIEMYRYVAEEKKIQIQTQLPAHALLEADADRICQVLANILDNAVKFTPENGKVRITIETLRSGIKLEVADSGIGIDPAEIHRIWDRLYRGPYSTHKGLGLGLSLVRAVVHAHQGEIGVSSTPGAGSVFWMLLPTAKKHDLLDSGQPAVSMGLLGSK